MRVIKIIAWGVVVLAFSGVALHADSLYLSSTTFSTIPFSTGSEGGGSIEGAFLNGSPLPWVYCLQVAVNIYVPGMYDQTIVTADGTIDNTVLPSAAKIAWLLENYAIGGQPNSDQEVALQAAIWNVEGFGDLVAPSDSNVMKLYQTMLGSVGNGDSGAIGEFKWLTPGKDGQKYQALVAAPDGGVTAILLGGVLIGLETLRRRFKV